MVDDVWDSQEASQRFGATLMPIIADVGVDLGEPTVMPLHRLEQEAR
jgi:hypothetical protein